MDLELLEALLNVNIDINSNASRKAQDGNQGAGAGMVRRCPMGSSHVRATQESHQRSILNG
jgi:hypothetical protein